MFPRGAGVWWVSRLVSTACLFVSPLYTCVHIDTVFSIKDSPPSFVILYSLLGRWKSSWPSLQ